jgi:hypothetical protein
LLTKGQPRNGGAHATGSGDFEAPPARGYLSKTLDFGHVAATSIRRGSLGGRPPSVDRSALSTRLYGATAMHIVVARSG